MALPALCHAKIRRWYRRLSLSRQISPATYACCLMGSLLVVLLLAWRFMPSRSTKAWHNERLLAGELSAVLQSLPKPPSDGDSWRCIAPSLPLYNEFIRSHRPQPISADICERSQQENWLFVSKSRVFIKPPFSNAQCTAEPIVRDSDDQTSSFNGNPQPIQNGSELPSLGFQADCKTPDGRQHRLVYYGVNRVATQPTASSSQQDNIIIVGLDSLSRLESLRSLQRVSRLMQSRLGSVTLQQYNIMGDGTPAALVPILGGVRETDMPEARKGFKGARHLDQSMRWIFHELSDRGYISLYGEEQNAYGNQRAETYRAIKKILYNLPLF